MQKQSGGYDCGVFAIIAFATALAHGINLEGKYLLNQQKASFEMHRDGKHCYVSIQSISEWYKINISSNYITVHAWELCTCTVEWIQLAWKVSPI